jgi:hypothetical protein
MERTITQCGDYVSDYGNDSCNSDEGSDDKDIYMVVILIAVMMIATHSFPWI